MYVKEINGNICIHTQALAFYPFSSRLYQQSSQVYCVVVLTFHPFITYVFGHKRNIHQIMCSAVYFICGVGPVCKLFGSIGLTRVTKESFLNTLFHVVPFQFIFSFAFFLCVFVRFGLFVISILYFSYSIFIFYFQINRPFLYTHRAN